MSLLFEHVLDISPTLNQTVNYKQPDGIFSFQVAVADHDGVVTCFGMKKGEAVVCIRGCPVFSIH